MSTQLVVSSLQVCIIRGLKLGSPRVADISWLVAGELPHVSSRSLLLVVTRQRGVEIDGVIFRVVLACCLGTTLLLAPAPKWYLSHS